MNNINELQAKYKLSEEEIKSIGQEIIDSYSIGVYTEIQPHVIILGGQPGAGKSELTNIAKAILNENAVTCNADEYRDFHPKADEIKRLHEEYYPEITVAYSQPWNNMLRKYCEDNHYNFILETTFSSGKIMNETIKDLKQKGYTVSIMILAINKQISFLGTRIRYEDMYLADKSGRQVDRKIHDEKYEKVAETLLVVEKEKYYDHIYIYGRASLQNQKGKHNGLLLISRDSTNPLIDYLSERDKVWSDNDIRYFLSRILQLIRMMVDREAPHAELKMVLNTFETN